MKIAMSLLSGVSYGGVTYFDNLLPALAKIDKFNEYHVFLYRNNTLSKKIDQGNFVFETCPERVKSALQRLFWEQLILPMELKRGDVDVMFTAKNANIILAPCKTVISIRNVEPLSYKNFENHWMLDVLSWLRRALTVMSIRRADRIVAVSRYVKNEIEKLRPGIADKVHVIYNGNPVHKENKRRDIVNLNESRPFILSASKFVAYANQQSLIEGYALLQEKRKDVPNLYFAGGVLDQSYYEKVKRLINERNIAGNVRFLGLIPHWHLVALYSRAHAFVFPSTLEACPQTLIEAMACGVPIACSIVPPMPEICQDGAVYFDPYDTHDVAEKVESVVYDEGLRKRLRENSIKRSRFFDWEKTAASLVRVFETMCGSGVSGAPG